MASSFVVTIGMSCPLVRRTYDAQENVLIRVGRT
jgi:hypothetical protein